MLPDPSPARPLIGRAEEVDELGELLGLGDPARRSGSVLLAGDAGVGKSRLLAELRTKFQAHDWRVLVGHCLDFGDSALPYLPFSEMFGRLTHESPALAESIAGTHPGVQRLMPGMRRLGDPVEMQALRVERGDLIESVHAALEQLGRAAPLLVIVEDVHWAEQSTREMLSFLFSRQFLQPVSLVASYRSDDLHRRHPLRGAVAEWSRLPGVTRIQLAPLGDSDVRSLIHSLHPGPLPESDLQAMVARAEGNAFFAEELVGAAELGRRALPDDLAELLLVRLDQLDEVSSLAVRAISVAGRGVSHGLLVSVLDMPDATLDGALRAAVERNILVPMGADGYAFRHALLAEAVYDDLLPGERVRLHQAYSAALRGGGIESTAAEVARHARAAHDLSTAVRASIQAGAEAMAVGGPDEAAQHYQVALELVADERTGGRDGTVDIVDLTTRASEAVTAAGHPYRSVELVRDQLAQLPPDGPPGDRARLLVALANAALVSDTNVDPLTTTTEALGLVDPEPPTPLRAELLSLHARANAARHRDDDAARWGHEAITLGRLLGLPAVVADATTTLSRLDDRSTDPEASQRALVHIIEQARLDEDLVGELRGLHNLGYTHYERGQLEEAQSVYDQAAARAGSAGRPWAPYGLDARVLASITAYIRGDWEAASGVADVSGESPPEVAEAALTAAGLMVAAGRGQHSALEKLSHVRSWWDRDGLIPVIAGSAAIDLYGDAGEYVAALAVHDEVVALVSRLWQEETFGARVRLSALALGQLATQASRAAAAERPALVRRGEQLQAAAAETVGTQRRRNLVIGPEGAAWAARVEAEHIRLAWLTGAGSPSEDELVGAWEHAVAGFEELGHVFETARSQVRLAAVLRSLGRPALVRPLVDEARATARRLGAGPLLAELRTLGSAVSGRPARAATRDGDLTAREREILGLVVEGRTNADIARQLFISAKTVSVHLSNILAKLGAAGRTEAAALARRRGLIDD